MFWKFQWHFAQNTKEWILNSRKISRLCSLLSSGETPFKYKTSRDRKWLPQIDLISCWGAKLLLTKDFCQKYFFDQNLSCWVVNILVVEFCHNLSCWIWSQLEFFFICQTLSWVLSQFKFLSFVSIQVFEYCYNLTFFVFFLKIWFHEFYRNFSLCVLSQFKLISVVTIWVFEFCHILIFFEFSFYIWVF